MLTDSLEKKACSRKRGPLCRFLLRPVCPRTDFGAYILDYALQDEIYISSNARRKDDRAPLKACLQAELPYYRSLADQKRRCTARDSPYEGFLPDWDNSAKDFTAVYMEHG